MGSRTSRTTPPMKAPGPLIMDVPSEAALVSHLHSVNAFKVFHESLALHVRMSAFPLAAAAIWVDRPTERRDRGSRRGAYHSSYSDHSVEHEFKVYHHRLSAWRPLSIEYSRWSVFQGPFGHTSATENWQLDVIYSRVPNELELRAHASMGVHDNPGIRRCWNSTGVKHVLRTIMKDVGIIDVGTRVKMTEVDFLQFLCGDGVREILDERLDDDDDMTLRKVIHEHLNGARER